VTDVHLVGCGIDYGAGRRGVDMGPSMVRFADIGPKLADMGYSVHDRGDVTVPEKDTVAEPAPGEKARYHEIIGPVLADLARHTDDATTKGAFPITIGGVSAKLLEKHSFGIHPFSAALFMLFFLLS
jgi:arginase